MTQAVVYENNTDDDFEKKCSRFFQLEKKPEAAGNTVFTSVESLNVLHKGKVLTADVFEAKEHAEYHALRAFIYVGKAESATGLGIRRAVVQCDTEYADTITPGDSFLVPETLFVVRSHLVFYKGDFNGADGVAAQERALDLASKAANDAIIQYLDSGSVITDEE